MRLIKYWNNVVAKKVHIKMYCKRRNGNDRKKEGKTEKKKKGERTNLNDWKVKNDSFKNCKVYNRIITGNKSEWMKE